MKIDNQKEIVLNFVKFIAYVFKWLMFMACVIYLGLTIGLAIISLIVSNNLLTESVSPIIAIITSLDKMRIVDAVMMLDLTKVILATCGYGLVLSITYGAIYSIMLKFIKLLDSISEDNLYSKENAKVLEDIIPMSALVAFALPVTVYFISVSIGLFTESDMNFTGVIFLCVAFIVKVMFDKGMEYKKINDKYRREINDLKAKESELIMSSIKKDNEIKNIKTKKVNKSTEKKTSTKKKSITKKEK